MRQLSALYIAMERVKKCIHVVEEVVHFKVQPLDHLSESGSSLGDDSVSCAMMLCEGQCCCCKATKRLAVNVANEDLVALVVS